jgi:arylsulfatase A-like enzyme
MRTFGLFSLCLSAAALASAPAAEAGTAAKPRPNIVVVLADDMGFSDPGCYGSEIATPTLDRLAANGLRFTQFYNTAKCHSSRVSLLSGRWCRQAGDQSLAHATTIAEMLAPAGYFTAMTGKWHLSKEPTEFGFHRYFGHLSGATNYFLGDNTFRLNGRPWNVPDKGFYTTVANVDFALRFLAEAREAKKPWCLYVAFNAPHAPLQPLEADYKKYLGRYEVGWDVMRAARVAKQKELGLFDKDLQASPRPEHIPAWDTLSAKTRSWEARRMAAYAGLIDRVDQELGRLVADLQRNGELENTLILFFSDNGACPFDRGALGRDREPYDPTTHWSDSTGWAWARNTPFRYYKQNQFEGGITSPAIVHWPSGLKTKPGAVVHSPAHLVDVLPTLAELAGAPVPAAWPGRDLSPLAGISLAPIFAGQEIKSRPPIHLLFGNDRGLRDGDWKIVSFRSEPWELYNVAEDRTELHDVAAKNPEMVARLAKLWHDMAANVLHAPAREREPVATTASLPHRNAQWTHFSDPDDGGISDEELHDRGSKKEKAGKKKALKPVATDQQPSGKERGSHRAVEGVRARAGTRLSVDHGQLVLQCTGNDPGLAFDALPSMAAAGPYTLEFRVQSRASGEGHLYWTVDEKTTLPRGSRLPFAVKHDGQWQSFTLKVPETRRLYGLRLDPCSGPGEVRIDLLRLKDATGSTLKSWP